MKDMDEEITCQSCKAVNPRMTVCSECIPNPSYSQKELDKAVLAERERWQKKLKPLLDYCLEANGRTFCKNCGLDAALIELESS